MRNVPTRERILVAWVPQTALSEGWLGLRASECGITRVVLPQPTHDEILSQVGQGMLAHTDSLLLRTYWQLRGFLSGRRQQPNVPVDVCRQTAFARQALAECRRISPGETASYGELARRLGRPDAARAVGQAMARNPVPLAVPCHRVIRADGSLGGFGAGADIKRRLLRLEDAEMALLTG